MVNAWSLLGSILNETLDEDYPIMTDDKNRITPQESDEYDPIGSGNTASSDSYGNITINGIDGVETIYVGDKTSDDGFDYDNHAYSIEMGLGNVDLADVDDQRAHHFGTASDYSNTDLTDLNIQANSPYNDGWTQQAYKEMIEEKKREPKRDGRYKYHEAEIMNDIEDYISSTYNGHYTGTQHQFRNIQTIDLMASRDLASDFCQANILKYGSRYGSKDGCNKKDLMKVIHYAMLLLHFDEHYGTPSTSDGTFEQMP